MANLSNINNKFLVTTTGEVLIGQTAAVGSPILQVTGASSPLAIHTPSGNNGLEFILDNGLYTNWQIGVQNQVGNALTIVPSTAAGNTTFSTPVATFLSSGKVGIGTPSPVTKLELKGLIASSVTNDRETTTSSFVINGITENMSLQFGLGGSALNYGNWIQSGYDNGVPTAASLYLNPIGGNVGIGTSTPTSKLHIVSDEVVLGSVITDYRDLGVQLATSQETGNSGTGISFDHGALGAAIASARATTTTWGTDLRFYTHPDATTNQRNVTERMRIDSSGEVRAQRSRSNTVGDMALSVDPGDTVVRYGWRVDQTNNSLNLDFSNVPWASTNTNLVTYTSTGNVGIGTTSPPVKLSINGWSYNPGSDGSGCVGLKQTGASSYGYVVEAAANDSWMMMGHNGTNGIIETTYATSAGHSDLHIKTGSANVLTLQSTGGKVNIGSRRAALPSNFGYSSSYKVLILGSSGTNYQTDAVTLSLGVDVSGNLSGSFNGSGREIIIRNEGSFISPNASNNGYNNIFSWNSSGQPYFANNVGIGTTSPQNDKLHVETDTSTVYDGNSNQTGGLFVNNIYHEALNTFSQIRLGVSGASGASTVRLVGIEPSQAASDFAIVLRNGSVWGEKLRIKGATGRVGIGTNDPQAALDISSNYSIQGGVRTYAYQGNAAGTTNINLDITVGNEGGQGNVFKIEAGFAHYYAMNYNSVAEWWCTSRGTAVINTYILNAGTTLGGDWSASKPNSTTLRISKSSGTYGGTGKYWVKVTYVPF